MEYGKLRLERSDGIAIITLNRPDKKNAINREMAASNREGEKESPKLSRCWQSQQAWRAACVQSRSASHEVKGPTVEASASIDSLASMGCIRESRWRQAEHARR